MNNDLTDDVIKNERDYWREQANDKAHTYVPPQNAKRLADICDRALESKTEFPGMLVEDVDRAPCRACGERIAGSNGYCQYHGHLA